MQDKNFFPIETPYSSKEYEIMKNVVNQGIDSRLNAFTKSEFKKSPFFNNKFLFNVHLSELPILIQRLDDLYNQNGDEDYLTMKEDLEGITNSTEHSNAGEEEYEMNEDELREMIRAGVAGMMETSSDSLQNAHGENLKPNTMAEVTDTERYEDVVYMQGDEAETAMDILNGEGEEATLEYLKQWHNPGQGQGSNELGHGNMDRTFEKDGYIMAWNPHIPYIGLQYDTESAGMNEDSHMRRHQSSQRGKIGDMPLGQHAPNSPNAK